MYGLTRATVTLIAAAVAGLLIWIGTQVTPNTNGKYWLDLGLVAAAGLVMALSQLLGGWTKWGWPRLSGSVFLLAFVPVLIVAGWILLYLQPGSNWFADHVSSWSGDLHIRGFVEDMAKYAPVLAFGIGLVLGYSFDTTGPVEPARRRRGAVAGAAAADAPAATTREHEHERGADRADERADERRVEIREGGEPSAPPPEPGPRGGEPPPER
jgi:hypothetical protein